MPRSRLSPHRSSAPPVRLGVTLLEALLAAALLAMMVVAVLPFLRPAIPDSDDGAREDRRQALAHFADTVIQVPAALGLAGPPEEDVVLDWPAELARHEALRGIELSPVSIHILRSEQEDVDHAWMICTMADVRVARWMPVAPPAAAAPPNEQEGTDGP